MFKFCQADFPLLEQALQMSQILIELEGQLNGYVHHRDFSFQA